MNKLVQIQRYHTEVFAKFVERLSKAQEAGGTVLDHSTILFGSNMSNSDRHNNDPLPAAILGHAQRTHQGRPAREVSAGLALCRSAGDAVRPQQHPGGEDRRQRRHLLGDLSMRDRCDSRVGGRFSRDASACASSRRGAVRRAAIARSGRPSPRSRRRRADAARRRRAWRSRGRAAPAGRRAPIRMRPGPTARRRSCGPRRTTISSWCAR